MICSERSSHERSERLPKRDNPGYCAKSKKIRMPHCSRCSAASGVLLSCKPVIGRICQRCKTLWRNKALFVYQRDNQLSFHRTEGSIRKQIEGFEEKVIYSKPTLVDAEEVAGGDEAEQEDQEPSIERVQSPEVSRSARDQDCCPLLPALEFALMSSPEHGNGHRPSLRAENFDEEEIKRIIEKYLKGPVLDYVNSMRSKFDDLEEKYKIAQFMFEQERKEKQEILCAIARLTEKWEARQSESTP